MASSAPPASASTTSQRGLDALLSSALTDGAFATLIRMKWRASSDDGLVPDRGPGPAVLPVESTQMGGGETAFPRASSPEFGSEKMTSKPAPKKAIPRESVAASARDTAQRAMFSAASRVLSYHASALEAKVARFNLARLQSDLSALRGADQPGH